MRRFTNSELTTWKQCRRRWWLTYYRQLGLVRENPVSAASLGTLVHLGLEVHYTGGDAIAAMNARIQADRADVTVEESMGSFWKRFDKQADLARVMVEGYLDWIVETGADSNLEFLVAERHVEVELKPGVSLLGKLDAKFRRRSDGAVVFMDHKTTMSIDQTAEQAYRSSQFRTYALLEYLESLNSVTGPVRTDGVIVNMLRKVGRSATAKPPFYGREELRINVELLRNHWHQVMAEIGRIENAERMLNEGEDHHTVVPPSPSRDCSWACQFKSVCPMFDDGSDPEAVLSTFFERRDPLARYGENEDPTDD